jgi:RNA polymerase sigma-70 factor (ECF subfamily)
VALKFCQNANVLNNGVYLYPWLETVLLHCHYSEHRKKDGIRVIPVSALRDTSATYDELNLKLDSIRENEISEEALQKEFAILLNELTPLERMIVELSVVGGFNIREMSRLIGLSKSNIVNRRMEAFKKMRGKMLGQQKNIKNITGRIASLREIIECVS